MVRPIFILTKHFKGLAMHISHTRHDFALAKRAMHRLPATAHQLVCNSGSLWITQDGDPRDIILNPGDCFESDGRRLAIAYALDAASMTLRTACPATAPLRRPLRSPAARGLVME